ncbi:unnamed protein product [Rotaria sp. Silwood1]|nr:unnamed protein product [Rotaria sp. Silwood1]CAF4994857.1 unnamed protein product [Rotaria sp. Silwood1]
MESTIIEVRFRQTGETIHVPVSSTSTVKDIIKCVCEESVCREQIEYDNYYLVSLNKKIMLDDSQTFDEIQVLSRENPDFQVCMKTAVLQIMLELDSQYTKRGLSERGVHPKIPVDDAESIMTTVIIANSQPSTPETDALNDPNVALCTSQINIEANPIAVIPSMSSDRLKQYLMSELPQGSALPNTQSGIFCGTSSYKDTNTETFDTKLESNMHHSCSISSPSVHRKQGGITPLEENAVSSDNDSNSSSPKALGSAYRHVTSKGSSGQWIIFTNI